MSVSTTISQQLTHCLRASVTIRRPCLSQAVPRALLNKMRLVARKTSKIMVEMQRCPRRTFSLLTASINLVWVITEFSYIKSFGDGSCKSEELGIPGANWRNQLRFDIHNCRRGILALGDRGFAPFQGGTNVFTVADSLDLISGKHNLKVGAEFRANQMNVETNSFQDGFWIFSNAWTASVSDLGGGFLAAGASGGTRWPASC